MKIITPENALAIDHRSSKIRLKIDFFNLIFPLKSASFDKAKTLIELVEKFGENP